MAGYGYGNVADRAFVAFDRELEEGAWKAVSTSNYEDAVKQNAALLLTAPLPVVWKLQLRSSIAEVLVALGAPAIATLDDTWDAAERRLFHHIAIGVDSDNASVRAAADRLRSQLLSGSGTAQTQLSCDDEVDFGRQQIALTSEGGPLAADAKKVKVVESLADIHKATEALAQALGRGTNEKRKTPSKQLREALGECTTAFNSVHEQLAWFISKTPPGTERDGLQALLAPLEALLERTSATTCGITLDHRKVPISLTKFSSSVICWAIFSSIPSKRRILGRKTLRFGRSLFRNSMSLSAIL